MGDPRETFLQAVRKAPGIPEEAKAAELQPEDIQVGAFDHTYIEFLDTQIELCARGPEWNEILRRRRDALAPYCDIDLIDGRIVVGGGTYCIKVDPLEQKIVHWERVDFEWGRTE